MQIKAKPLNHPYIFFTSVLRMVYSVHNVCGRVGGNMNWNLARGKILHCIAMYCIYGQAIIAEKCIAE